MPAVMDAIISDIILTLIGVVSLIVTTLLAACSRKVIALIDAKARAAGSEAHYAAFRCATEKLDAWSRTAVAEVEQTLVRKYKRQHEWNDATAKSARDTAVAVMVRHAGARGLAELRECLGVDEATVLSMFRTWIEARVHADAGGSEASPIVDPDEPA